MAQFFLKSMADNAFEAKDLTEFEVRNQISVAFKNYINIERTAVRTIDAVK